MEIWTWFSTCWTKELMWVLLFFFTRKHSCSSWTRWTWNLVHCQSRPSIWLAKLVNPASFIISWLEVEMLSWRMPIALLHWMWPLVMRSGECCMKVCINLLAYRVAVILHQISASLLPYGLRILLIHPNHLPVDVYVNLHTPSSFVGPKVDFVHMDVFIRLS